MSRTTIIVPYNGDYNTINNDIMRVLSQNNFKETNYHGEVIWKKGIAILTALQCVKLEFDENKVTISAWISNTGIEMSLDGVINAVPKKSLMKVIEQIKSNIR